ncbi:MAG: hypothetical protein NTV19_00640 [Burkholderiales bacterium]|nr:hypothetical protein [Burkholderiales bacterium]
MPAEISCTHFSENGQPAGRARSGESGSRGKVAASSTVTSGGRLAGAPGGSRSHCASGMAAAM